MKLSKKEQRTASLYGEIHIIGEQDYFESASNNVLTAENLEVPKDFLNGKRCLDAGTGGKGVALRGLFRLGSRDITAIDLSEDNIRNAQRTNEKIAKSIKFETKNILEMDYPDKSFDFIYCNGVIHHTESPDTAVKQFYRCLSPGGHICVGLYGKGGILYSTAKILRSIAKIIPYKIAFRLVKLLFNKNASVLLLDYLYVPYQFHYKECEAKELLSKHGFENIQRLKQPPPLLKSVWCSLLKPSYYDPSTMLGKIMVGSGWIILMAQRPDS